MTLTPLNDKVVLKVAKKTEEITASGLVLPENSIKDVPNQGVVIAVGPGRVVDGSFTRSTDGSEPVIARLTPTVKVGDSVVFNAYAPTIVTLDGEDFHIVKEDDILSIVS